MYKVVTPIALKMKNQEIIRWVFKNVYIYLFVYSLNGMRPFFLAAHISWRCSRCQFML